MLMHMCPCPYMCVCVYCLMFNFASDILCDALYILGQIKFLLLLLLRLLIDVSLRIIHPNQT